MNERKVMQESKFGNTIFVGYDRDGVTPKYCSLRASHPDSKFKMDAENSDKSFRFFIRGEAIS